MNLPKNPLRIIGAVVLLSALVTLALSAFFYQRARNFVRDAIRADGKVVRGVEREVYSSAGSFPPSHSVGDTVTLLYEPEQPNDAKTDDFLSLWGLPAILGGAGVFDLLIGVALFFGPVIISRFRHPSAPTNVA